MKWLGLLIYRLSSGQWPDLKAVHSTYHRLTDGLPTWVEQSKDTCSWSTSSFPTFIYSGSIISFLSLSIIFIFLCPHIFIFIYTVHAGCLYVTDTLSTPTITELPLMECQDLLIPIACVARIHLGLVKVPSERLHNFNPDNFILCADSKTCVVKRTWSYVSTHTSSSPCLPSCYSAAFQNFNHWTISAISERRWELRKVMRKLSLTLQNNLETLMATHGPQKLIGCFIILNIWSKN